MTDSRARFDVPGSEPDREAGEDRGILPGAEGARPPLSRRARPVSWYVLTLVVLITLNFFLPRALPGDPIAALMSSDSPAYVQDEAIRAELAEYYGLDRSLWEQYWHYLGDLTTGNLGTSIRHNVPVSQLVRERLGWTILLMGTAIALAVVVGWVAGVTSAWRRGRRADQGLLTIFLGLHSFPVFFLASLGAYVFGVTLGWFPLGGARTAFAAPGSHWEMVVDVMHHLALPAGVLAVQFVTSQYLDMRASMVSELGSDYLLAGRARGLRKRRLKYGYAARNALLPVVAITGVHVGSVVTGAILVETVFVYPGLGRLMFEAVAFRDYPTLQGCFLLLALVVVTANFAADALTSRLDPRTHA